MPESPLVAIIIPCKEIDGYARECIESCKKLDYESYEIVVLPDNASENIEGVRIVPTGSVTSGAKRNIGIANSKGEICAFIDSDAYPRRNWLSNAVKYFNDPQVAAVGGPGLTPMEENIMQRASGYVLSSFMVGHLSNRYKAKGCFESDDIHSCNFVVRKSVLIKAGGWNEKYWPGEDTLICLAIKRLGKRLVEALDVVVYHHRKPLFRKHLKQLSSYGLHRGFFAKRFKENSLRPLYFAPSFLIIFFLAGGILSFVSQFTSFIFSLSLMGYMFLSLIASLVEVKDLKLIPVVWLGIILTHIFYGVSFIRGLLRSDLRR